VGGELGQGLELVVRAGGGEGVEGQTSKVEHCNNIVYFS
jgi:hypothetical protein